MKHIVEIDKKVVARAKQLLAMDSADAAADLFRQAYGVKLDTVGPTVYLRGLVEFSNICSRNCLYCGIRKSNRNTPRFRLSKEEILDAARWTYQNQYGSLVLQSGERNDDEFIDFVEDTLREIKKIGGGALGVTISLGEQTRETYQRWFDAGAHRYLLRIETTNPTLYAILHPDGDNLEKRARCLTALRDVGYQVGTGVMIGLPEQTIDDLARDIAFFKAMDIDMIGMGPFIPHHDTPLADLAESFDPEKQFNLALRMIAATRIILEDVNIAAATALQALKEDGRERALKAGANIIMPNVTATKYRRAYQLYDNKPCLDENSNQCKTCLANRILSQGESIGLGQWGDAPHFAARVNPEKRKLS